MGRRKLCINREIQLKTVLYVFVFLVLTSIFISISTFNSVWSMLVNYLAVGDQKNLIRIFDVTFKTFAIRITLLTIFLAILACLGMLILSHRIAGPAYRITQALKDLQEGRKPILTLRKGDSMGDVMTELKNFSVLHFNLINTSKRVLEIWNKTQVQDPSLNMALKELEDCFQIMPQNQENNSKKEEV